MKHESLALRTNIEYRGIPIADAKCLFCGRVDEDALLGKRLLVGQVNRLLVARVPALLVSRYS